jgi:DNA-binding response OmpR family regulator
MSAVTMPLISRSERAIASKPELDHSGICRDAQGNVRPPSLRAASGSRAGGLQPRLTVLSSDSVAPSDVPLATALRALGYDVEVGTGAFQSFARGDQPPAAFIIVAHSGEGAEKCLSQAATLDPASTAPILLCAPVEVVRHLAWARFNDFLAVPFAVTELSERVRRLTRRDVDVPVQTRPEVLEVDGMVIDLAGRDVFLRGRSVRLTRLEFDLLAFFIANPRRVLRRAELLASVWGISDSFSRTVDIHLRRLRVKIGDEGQLIQTVRGVGYKLAAEVRAVSNE